MKKIGFSLLLLLFAGVLQAGVTLIYLTATPESAAERNLAWVELSPVTRAQLNALEKHPLMQEPQTAFPASQEHGSIDLDGKSINWKRTWFRIPPGTFQQELKEADGTVRTLTSTLSRIQDKESLKLDYRSIRASDHKVGGLQTTVGLSLGKPFILGGIQ